jgi:hypothetical protein
LPYGPEEFRRELVRRLDLLDREIGALDCGEIHEAFEASVEPLRRARKEIESRLAAHFEAGLWDDRRMELCRLWQRYRRDFERLAATWQRRHAARPGQREKGPRW